jgi:hypothetical protein
MVRGFGFEPVVFLGGAARKVVQESDGEAGD